MGDELKSCPFCGTEMKRHDHCFAHPRPEDGDCILRHYSFDKGKAGAWNTRTETQSQATIDELVGALREASKVFREYAASHSRKAGDADGVDEWMDRQRKAARNTDYADKIDTTLANIEKES